MPNHPSKDYPTPHADPPSQSAPESAPDVTPATEPDIPAEITPLAIILKAMRDRYEAKDYDAAVALARIAAPYLHPRVPPKTPPTALATLPDDDLDAFPTRD